MFTKSSKLTTQVTDNVETESVFFKKYLKFFAKNLMTVADTQESQLYTVLSSHKSKLENRENQLGNIVLNLILRFPHIEKAHPSRKEKPPRTQISFLSHESLSN